jgi:hypothetical protein
MHFFRLIFIKKILKFVSIEYRLIQTEKKWYDFNCQTIYLMARIINACKYIMYVREYTHIYIMYQRKYMVDHSVRSLHILLELTYEDNRIDNGDNDDEICIKYRSNVDLNDM